MGFLRNREQPDAPHVFLAIADERFVVALGGGLEIGDLDSILLDLPERFAVPGHISIDPEDGRAPHAVFGEFRVTRIAPLRRIEEVMLSEGASVVELELRRAFDPAQDRQPRLLAGVYRRFQLPVGFETAGDLDCLDVQALDHLRG